MVHCAGGNTDFDRPAADDLESLAADWRANPDGSIATDKDTGAYGAAKAAVASWNIDIALGKRPSR